MNRTGNYSAFYVKEPFKETNLGANVAHDFCYYNTLKMWKGKDSNFPFNDSHNKNYNVRDNSSWQLFVVVLGNDYVDQKTLFYF